MEGENNTHEQKIVAHKKKICDTQPRHMHSWLVRVKLHKIQIVAVNGKLSYKATIVCLH